MTCARVVNDVAGEAVGGAAASIGVVVSIGEIGDGDLKFLYDIVEYRLIGHQRAWVKGALVATPDFGGGQHIFEFVEMLF